MKKEKIISSTLGFVLQIVFLIIIARRTAFGGKIYPYYLLVTGLILLYNLVLGQKDRLMKSSAVIFLGTLFACLTAGLLAGVGSFDLAWLLIYGIIIGFLVMVVLYHGQRFFFNVLSEQGFDLPVEMALTFFSCASFASAAYLQLKIHEAAVLVVLILLISFLVGFAIAVPMKKSIRLINETIKQGIDVSEFPVVQLSIIKDFYEGLKNLLVSVKGSYREIGSIGSNIKTSSEDLSSASEEMNASLEEVSSTIQHIAKGAQEQSESITTIAHSIEELNGLTTSISSQVKMASVSSRRTTDSAKQGMEFSTKVAKILKDIFEQTKFIEKKMTELRDQATEIKKVLDIIGSITEQTDLLALNAAIEAARVGEQGRGFAVVADEIRNLANETQRSSSTVENLVSEINKSTQELNNLLNFERERITDANDLATQTEEEFTGISKAVELVTDMITRINEAAANQASHTKELVKQVEQVAQVAADTAAASQEVSAAVQQQTASMEEFTSTAQVLASVVTKLESLLKQGK